MSSGPAICTMNGMMPSATGDPSSGMRARLYTADLRRTCAAAGLLDGGPIRTNEQDRRPRPSQYGLGNATEDDAAEPTAAVRAHDDQVDATGARGVDDRVAGRSVPDGRFHLGHASLACSLRHALEIRFGLANDL